MRAASKINQRSHLFFHFCHWGTESTASTCLLQRHDYSIGRHIVRDKRVDGGDSWEIIQKLRERKNRIVERE